MSSILPVDLRPPRPPRWWCAATPAGWLGRL